MQATKLIQKQSLTPFVKTPRSLYYSGKRSPDGEVKVFRIKVNKTKIKSTNKRRQK